MTEPVLRAATTDDIEAVEAVLHAADQPPAGEPPLPPHAQDAYLRHLVVHGRAAVVEVGGLVVGFAATVSTKRATHLADLFVRPDHQGAGHGGRLLAAAFGDAWPRTTFSSDDPRAMPLYIRAGMTPLWPNLYLTGDPNRLPGLEGVTVHESTIEDVAALDGEWAGVDRSDVLELWHSLPDVHPCVVRRGSEPVAAFLGRRRYNTAGRWIDRARVAPGEDPIAPLVAAFRQSAEGGDQVGGCVPGPSPLVPVLLAAGFRIRDRDTWMTSDPLLVDPSRIVGNTGVP